MCAAELVLLRHEKEPHGITSTLALNHEIQIATSEHEIREACGLRSCPRMLARNDTPTKPAWVGPHRGLNGELKCEARRVDQIVEFLFARRWGGHGLVMERGPANRQQPMRLSAA